MTERELSRNATRRLAIIRHAEEVTGNVALTCRYYGITSDGRALLAEWSGIWSQTRDFVDRFLRGVAS